MGESIFWTRVAPVLCMFSLAVGQILFKLVAVIANRTPLLSSLRGMSLLVGSLALYGLSSVAWIFALRYSPLSRAYPILALAYVFVPIGSYAFLGERVSASYWVGVLLLMTGIVIIGRSQVSQL